MELKMLTLPAILAFALLSAQTGVTCVPTFGWIPLPIPLPNQNAGVTVASDSSTTVANAPRCIVLARGCPAEAGTTPTVGCVTIGSNSVCNSELATAGPCLWPANQRNCIIETPSTPVCGCRNLGAQ
ncbi:unnamed protein product [Orchesella dallaii]|uniref:Uncharacterized protein n=1 Tax=Orchesella dallaii TaxID=48710 RepID=A0ABP1RF28_9HEXA